jgi:hypothetical protein
VGGFVLAQLAGTVLALGIAALLADDGNRRGAPADA